MGPIQLRQSSPFFLEHEGICTTIVAASCLNNIPGMRFCSYHSRFTFQLLQGVFIFKLRSRWMAATGCVKPREWKSTAWMDHTPISERGALGAGTLWRGGVQACRLFHKENLPWVSFQRGNPHVLFPKVRARCNITVKRTDVSATLTHPSSIWLVGLFLHSVP